jgi:macrolide transport system ATP-binding/permease protein
MLHDLRYAVRSLRKSAGFSLVAILSLALGIGANSAIFSLANGILLRPMPVPHPSRVIVVQSILRGESLGGMFAYSAVSYPDFADLRKRSSSFAALAASDYSPFGFAVDKRAAPQMKFGVLVSGDFFRVLGVQTVLGRDFRSDEDQVVGRDAVTVLGYDLWKSEFGSSHEAVGKTIFLNGIAFTVIGVAPESFTGPDSFIRAQLYVPMAMGPRLAGDAGKDMLERRGDRQMSVYGRLKTGVSLSQAAAEVKVISRQLGETYPATNRTCSLVASSEFLSRLQRNPGDAVIVGVLLAMACVVLLIACANVMNLMLSRGRARAKEIAVRLAIGASRGRLVRQLLTESLIIALLGGALGLLIAQAGADLFSEIRIPSDIPIVIDFGLDPVVLLFTVFASLASAILFGLAPALQSTNPALAPALKSGKLDGGKRKRFLGRNALVIAQVAGCLVLLVFATQAYRGAAIVLSSQVGFRTDHLLTASFDPSLARNTGAETRQFYKRLLEQARTLNGVEDAALTQAVPMLPSPSQDRIVPEGVQLPPGTEAVSVLSIAVSEDYFRVFAIPIIDGRGFNETDRADTPRVAIVNELFARKYYPNRSAVGRRFRLNGANGPVLEIVGVAKQSKYLFPVEPPFDFLYEPLSQNPQTGMTLVLHTSVSPGELTGPLRALVRSIDAGQPIIGIRTMSEVFEQRARGTLNVLVEAIAGMGVLGLVLALIGLYGLMMYSVGLRQREIGIRMAIGADRAGVLRMVLQQGMTLAAVGIALGVLLWLLASRPVMAIVQAHSFSWSLLAAVAAGLMGAAALGAYAPARRASRVDPNTVLRQE